mmetsp:Transcript_371/g.574  ORF Transcript_371/g.574 Transcript_371/m.574 type:complete len:94 (+) Transcript_371:132-413(+)
MQKSKVKLLIQEIRLCLRLIQIFVSSYIVLFRGSPADGDLFVAHIPSRKSLEIRIRAKTNRQQLVDYDVSRPHYRHLSWKLLNLDPDPQKMRR